MYDVDYFIKKFEAIPEDKWCTGKLHNNKGQSCALGHCGAIQSGDYRIDSKESADLTELFNKELETSVIVVNDLDANDPSSSPKQRILAALEWIKEWMKRKR